MSRLLADDDYYMSHGGKLPYKWCPPEVCSTAWQFTLPVLSHIFCDAHGYCC